jgi:hypothetical protein
MLLRPKDLGILAALHPDYEPEPPCPRREYALHRISALRGMSLEAAGAWLDHADAQAIEIAEVLAETCDPYRFVVWRRYH